MDNGKLRNVEARIQRCSNRLRQRGKTKGNKGNANFIKEHCTKVDAELDKICNRIFGVLVTNLVLQSIQDEPKVFCLKM